MDMLLRAKHWQIFLFAFGIPWLLTISIMGYGFADFFSMLKANPDPEDISLILSDWMSNTMLGILPITLLGSAVTYSWMYAVHQRISPIAPEVYRPSKKGVTFAIICVVLYAIFNLIVTGYLYKNIFSSIDLMENDPSAFESMGPTFFLVYAISMIGTFVNFGLMIYICYQLSRAVKGAELQRYLQSGETLGTFFGFFFLFVGIWFIQPIVNRLHEEGPGGGNSLDRSLLLDQR